MKNSHMIFICVIALLSGQLAPAWGRGAGALAASSAVLSETHGTVYKRGFKDWERQLWEDPQPASTGDELKEGMQLGTGDKSWAQLCWPNITTRAWANSVYAIAPNKRLVYLVGGEMLYHLSKERKDKDPYFVWTNLLQARIRGTTVLFQATDNTSRITVLEGCVDVMNRTDHSVIRLKPGVVYEIKTVGGQTKSTTTALTDLSKPDEPVLPLFQTAKTVSTLTPIDPQAVLAHPLLGGTFSTPLASLPLVQTSLASVSGLLDGALNDVGSITGGLTKTLSSAETKLLKTAVEIVSVPLSLSYKIETSTATLLGLPRSALEYFPPENTIGSLDPATGMPTGMITGAVNGAVGNSGMLNTIGGMTGGMTSALPVAGSASMISSQTASITSTVNGATSATVGHLGGITSTITGTTTTLLGGAGSTLSGTTTSLGNTLNNTVNSATNLLFH